MQQPTDHTIRPPVIGLLGHTGNHNLGDEAITEAVIKNLSARVPGVEFRLFTINPKDSQERHGYTAYPLRPTGDATISSSLYRYWQPVKAKTGPDRDSLAPLHERADWAYTPVKWKPSLKSRIGSWLRVGLKLPAIFGNEKRFDRDNLKLLEGIDLLIFTGSNQFLDNFGGPWAFPYTLYRWSRLAARSKTPIAFASVGAGPIYSKFSLRLIRRALRNAAYVSVRDIPSKVLLEEAGCEGSISVYPDLAFSLPDIAIDTSSEITATPVVGINPMPVYASYYWYVSDTRRYANYINALATFALSLQAKNQPFFFFATQTRDLKAIDEILDRIAEQSAEAIDRTALIRTSETVRELTDIVNSADVIIATRFHGAVLGLYGKKPVIGTCYYRKAADLLKEFGLKDYALPLEDVTAEQLCTKLDDIVSHRHAQQSRLDHTRKRYRQALDQQYDHLCALLTSSETHQDLAGRKLFPVANAVV